MMKTKRRRHLRGFTLVEVLIVLVILAILAAATLTALTGYIDKSKEQMAITEARRWYIAAQAAVAETYGETTTLAQNGSLSLEVEDYDDGNVSFGGIPMSDGVVTSDLLYRIQRDGPDKKYATQAEMIAYKTLQYVDSLNTDKNKNDYKFSTTAATYSNYGTKPDDYFSVAVTDDVLVQIFYSPKGKIENIEFAKRGYSKVIVFKKAGYEFADKTSYASWDGSIK